MEAIPSSSTQPRSRAALLRAGPGRAPAGPRGSPGGPPSGSPRGPGQVSQSPGWRVTKVPSNPHGEDTGAVGIR